MAVKVYKIGNSNHSGTIMPPVDENCSACKFVVNLDAEEYECRRYPPQIINARQMTTKLVDAFKRTGAYPCTKSDNWCGEWKKDTS